MKNQVYFSNSKTNQENIKRHFRLKNFFLLLAVLQALLLLVWTPSHSQSFITTWKTDNPGTSNNTSITIPTTGGGYNYDVDWNDDGTFDEFGIIGNVTHDFGVAGTYTIRIQGDFPRVHFNDGGDKEKILSIDQWGDIEWSSMVRAFKGANNLTYNASDAPNLSNVSSTSEMFRNASSFNGDLSGWDVSGVTNMASMFVFAFSFNGDISTWDVSNVTVMNNMFYGAISFNGDISAWIVSNVTNMSEMFRDAPSFNADIGGWDVSKVTNMFAMFSNAHAFNADLSIWDVSSVTKMSGMFQLAGLFDADISGWDVSSVTNMGSMFHSASSFNTDLNAWNVSNVTNMSFMFYSASSFNGNISSWDVSSVTNMKSMFGIANSFTGDISAWDVSSVQNMSGMFYVVTSFNADLSNWDVSSVTNMGLMFYSASSFNADISGWNVSNATTMAQMFRYASSFNQDLSTWDVSNVTSMVSMFYLATSFDQDLGAWNITSVGNMNSMQGMLYLSGLSVTNYDNTLIGWAGQTVQSGVSLGANGLDYCLGESARNILINTYGWTITGDNLLGVDGDNDGFTDCQGDCDDTDAAINPDAIEICDGIDNDCDGQIDEAGPCPIGDVVILSQSDLDNYINNYSGCNSIPTNLTIGPSTDIVNLDGLECIESIGAGFNLVNNSALVDMSGITNLTTVGNQISILNNPLLVTVDLEDINGSLGGSLEVQNNNGLVTLLGPTNLTTIGTNPFITKDLFIIGNPLLANITGFENLTSIGWRFRIANTLEDNLPDFSNLTSVGTDIVFESNQNALLINIPNVTGSLATDFKIQSNASLHTLMGPLNLTSIGHELYITGNLNLANITGFENLNTIGRRLWITETIEDDLPDFSNLTTLTWRISITNNPNALELLLPNIAGTISEGIFIFNNASMTTLKAPEFLSAVNGNVRITQNPITSFTGFNTLVNVDGYFRLQDIPAFSFPDMINLNTIGNNLNLDNNSGIENLNWIQNLQSIGGSLRIANNALLANCTIDAVCDFLVGSGSRSIGNNTGCCIDEPVLTAACTNGGSGESEICDGIDNNCDGQIDEGFDEDGDGFTTCQGDCDDTDAAINPDAIEICDGIDNNCDGFVDEGFDLDEDGFTSCEGDCDDNDANNYPGNTEICDGQDNNCDTEVDEGFDQDNDGVADCFDNCPDESNPNQEDEDCDGVGDICDQWPGCDDSLDSDNDGIPNCIDLDEMVNWPCGNNGSKVTVCHIPPGNPANRHDICISENAVSAHLNNHGDYIGECDQIYCEGNDMVAPMGGANTNQIWSEGFEIYPNPTTDDINIDLHNYLSQEISISIYNHLGQQVLNLVKKEIKNPVLNIELHNLQIPDGIYLLSVRTTEGQQTKQFVISK